MKLPKGWNELKLNAILNDKQMLAVLEILASESPEKFNRLRKYLAGYREQLEAKGVMPEYLGYFLEYKYRLLALQQNQKVALN